MVKSLSANAGDAGDVGSIPGLGRTPGGGNGNPLLYSCLENSIHSGSWWATVHGVLKSQTRLSNRAQHIACSQIESGKEHALHNRCIGANITKLNLEDSIFFFKGNVLVE